MPQSPTSQSSGARARILLVDDHRVVRSALAELIGKEEDLTVCGEAGSATEALDAAARLLPDLAVVDLALQNDLGGLELIKDLSQRFPRLRLLVLSMYDGDVFAERALRAGARGYVMKSEDPEVLLDAIRAVLRDTVYLDGGLAARLVGKTVAGSSGKPQGAVESLTDREVQVFQLIGQGYGTSRVADNLHISVKTVETYRARIKEKLGLRNAADLTETAVRWVRGLGSP